MDIDNVAQQIILYRKLPLVCLLKKVIVRVVMMRVWIRRVQATW